MNEQDLIEKLKRIEALHAGASTEGEREAALNAHQRIRERLKACRKEELIEFQMSLPDPWGRRVFIALVRRYGLQPYRRPRQRHSTVMVRMPQEFMDQTLWPEFQELNTTLRTYLTEITERIIKEGIHNDNSELEVRRELTE